jgi:hypothetical protein
LLIGYEDGCVFGLEEDGFAGRLRQISRGWFVGFRSGFGHWGWGWFGHVLLLCWWFGSSNDWGLFRFVGGWFIGFGLWGLFFCGSGFRGRDWLGRADFRWAWFCGLCKFGG